MTLDILFVSKNRREFTREALAALTANTNWDLVRRLWVCDDSSRDGTAMLVCDLWDNPKAHFMLPTHYGSPAAVMNAYMRMPDPPDVVAKIDNDTICPPSWLDACYAVMEAHPELDLLGIEPPASRVPKIAGGRRSLTPELTQGGLYLHNGVGYALCNSIGGIGLMRTRCFLENAPLVPYATYGGFTDWQLQHPRVTKGWIVPPLKVFLLDRLPMEPWVSLSRLYESKGWQRPWSKYPKDSTLWKWWTPVGQATHA